MGSSSCDFDTIVAQAEQACRAIEQQLATGGLGEHARIAAAQAEQARKMVEQHFATGGLAEDVRNALFGANAARAEQMRRAIGQFATGGLAEHERIGDALFGTTAAQVDQMRQAVEWSATGGLTEDVRNALFGATAAQAEQMRIAASTLLADTPRLTPDLFGGAWNEPVAEALRRLERTDALADVAHEPDLDRALEELAEDVATVQQAAPPEAQDRVNTRLVWLWVQRLAALAQLSGCLPAVFPVLGALLLALATPPEQPLAPKLPTTQVLEPATTALTLPGDWAVEGLPAIVQRAGPAAAERMVEFFTAQIRNAHTRAAYAKAVTRFLTWCDDRGLELYQISPIAVALYVEELQGVYRAPTIKQHLAAIRRLFNWLVVGQVVSWNPATTVRGPTHIVKRGKTPVLHPEEVRLLLDSIDTSAVGGLRDRALLGVMLYSFARVSAVVGMNVDDYYQQGKRWWLRLREKGGKEHALPVHHKGEKYLDAYLETAGIAGDKGTPLWRSLTRTRELGERRMSRVDVFRMVKRRVRAAELGDGANCHTFRASGITAYLLNGGTLERAQAIAGHESPRTTQLYDRTADDITVEDIERIRI